MSSSQNISPLSGHRFVRSRFVIVGLLISGGTIAALGCSRESGLERVDRTDGGIRVVGTLKDGKKHGRWTTWENGKVHEIENWHAGKMHGPWRRWNWYEDGTAMKSDGVYFHGQRHGRTRIFFENGAIALLGWYFNNRYERTWCSWELDGSLEYIRTYQQGKLIREEMWPPGQCPLLIFGDGKRHLNPENTDFD